MEVNGGTSLKPKTVLSVVKVIIRLMRAVLLQVTKMKNKRSNMHFRFYCGWMDGWTHTHVHTHTHIGIK